jgi:plasmid maintenance system antidote protein VapI
LDLMQEKNIGFNEILSILGTKSVVNEIINGKRVLKATQITQLAELFKINADVFNMEDDMQEVRNHSMHGQSSFNEPSAFNMFILSCSSLLT